MIKTFLIAAIVATAATIAGPATAQENSYLGTSGRIQDNAHQSAPGSHLTERGNDLFSTGGRTYGAPQQTTSVLAKREAASPSPARPMYLGTSGREQDNAEATSRF